MWYLITYLASEVFGGTLGVTQQYFIGVWNGT